MDDLTNLDKFLIAFDKAQRIRLASVISIILLCVFAFFIQALLKIELVLGLVFLIPIGGTFVILYFVKKGINNEQSILNSIIREKYLENFLSATPEGNSFLEQFLSIAKEIFPQIKISMKDFEKNISKTDSKIEIDYKHKKFIFEEINEKLTSKKLVSIISKASNDSLYRYVLLGANMTEFINSEEFENMMENVTKVDLISTEKNYLKIEWISR
tara:strand:+ start:445 stop:1086 length:642 start_codon:yes stop_codon:yes gene_type:complete